MSFSSSPLLCPVGMIMSGSDNVGENRHLMSAVLELGPACADLKGPQMHYICTLVRGSVEDGAD